MKYQSTRGGVSGLSFIEAVMMGLADDGGLLVPDSIPDVSGELGSWAEASYSELATVIMSHYIDDIPHEVLSELIETAYSAFDHPEVTPVVPVGDVHVLELFHGPTLAFKDVALQFLGAVFEWVLERDERSINIVGATSGDTGSAAIAGVRGKRNINIFIMFPEGRTSATQELQMTTVLDRNVHNLGVIGSFDDCQSMLKETFSDISFKNEYALAAVNSVNWARVLAQVVYYFFAWYRLGQPGQFDVCVPTGNFGNIFAGYIARQMGLPIRRFILATNENDILHRFFSTGVYSREDVLQTHSPAMDIQVSSNLERYLYFLMGRSTARVKRFMKQFASDGRADIPMSTRVLDDCFVSGVANNDKTLRTIREVFQQTGYLLDPHTAVAMHVASTYRDDVSQLVLSTAHPAKFSEAISQSGTPEVGHSTLDQLTELPTRKQVIPADLDVLKNTIRELSKT